VRDLNFKAETFRKTAGVHAAAVCGGNGSFLAFAEDVGRHNAVDKAIGMTAEKLADFSDCLLVLTGRLSGDVVLKAARVGIPVVASMAAALDSGVAVAKRSGITLVGFVRGKRMNIYCHAERISL
jgi:FdhD protein